MPHCLLEYSANVVDDIDAVALFNQLHRSLAEIEAIVLDDLKSRSICRDHFVVGDGSPQNAFVSLKVSLLTGSDISVRQRVVQSSLKVLEQAFARTLQEKACHLSVEVAEIERSTYAKVVPGAAASS